MCEAYLGCDCAGTMYFWVCICCLRDFSEISESKKFTSLNHFQCPSPNFLKIWIINFICIDTYASAPTSRCVYMVQVTEISDTYPHYCLFSFPQSMIVYHWYSLRSRDFTVTINNCAKIHCMRSL